MDILNLNAEQKLVHIAASIGRDPLSWRGWQCLHVILGEMDEALEQDCLLWTRSIVESYLRGVEGRVYYCDNGDIHVLCRDVNEDILHQAGTQICDLVFSESAVRATFCIYNLVREGQGYADVVLKSASSTLFPSESEENSPSGPDHVSDRLLPAQDGGSYRPKPSRVDEMRVLLVEDDPVTRWMVRNALRDTCHFVTAPSAHKAFAMYSSFDPDIVFLDINLPDQSGHTVLEWIMRNDPGAYVVMFSSDNNMDNIASALEDGAQGFISKPFLKEQLLHYMQGLS
ncbi:MAG: response regulator [Alphaproteobacteria bacterium]|nr:response regulator [Alphaproteobacteria bacterium]